MSSQKLLVIGLDGATLDLIEPWAQAGVLPVFRRLIAEGAHGRLRSVPNTDTAPAWTTFATGLNPAEHGLFHEIDWTPDRQTLRRVCGGERHGVAFWRLASDAGLRVAVVNVPFSYPAEPLNGVMIAGLDAPSIHAPGFCHPSDFMRKFLRKWGNYRIECEIQTAIKGNRPSEGLKDAYRVAECHTEALLAALSEGSWNLGVIAYNIPDEMQHFFWQQMRQNQGPQRTAILQGYQFIERQIERLIAFAGQETCLLVFSDHGFGPLCATPEYLASWLEEQRFLFTLPDAHQAWQKRLTHRAYNWLRHRLSEGFKSNLRRWLPALRSRVETDVRLAGIDWRKTVAFVGPSSCEVLINLQGRETYGIVRPGQEYERIREEVISALRAWRDPGTGQPVLRAVYRREEVYRGQFLQLAPDITVEWNPEAAPPAATLPGNNSRFDADHQPEGSFFAFGPGIRSGLILQNANLADVAPTILKILGISIPHGLHGRALLEIFTG